MTDPADILIEQAQARVGTTLKDKWCLDELIGVGGMAAVYGATHRNGMRVAVKILHPELSVSAQIRSRFLREGYVANKVDHPGAVLVLDDEVAEDGAVFLVMELLQGETLAQRLERQECFLDVSEVLLIADQVLDVLAAAHEKNIIHRDIKPDNVFATQAGTVKLLDFGIARLRELSSGSDAATRSGAFMGTPAYMAPEQARARWDEVDARTDLWALGATMFKLVSGRPVHQADTVNEQLLAAMTNPALPIASIAPETPLAAAEVIDRALAYDKDNRWPDARTMQAAVREAYEVITGGPLESAHLPMEEWTHEPVSSAAALAPTTPARSAGTTLAASRDSSMFSPRRRPRGRLLLVAITILTAFAAGYLGLGTTQVRAMASLVRGYLFDGATSPETPPPPARRPAAVPSTKDEEKTAASVDAGSPEPKDTTAEQPAAEPSATSVEATGSLEQDASPGESETAAAADDETSVAQEPVISGAHGSGVRQGGQKYWIKTKKKHHRHHRHHHR